MTNETLPPCVPSRIRSAPRIRQVYWCNLPKDAQLPEFWKRRPVLILSKTSTLFGSVTVLPFTTKSQTDNRMAHSIVSPLDKRRSWEFCDYLTSVAVSRLHLPGPAVPRVGRDDCNKIVALGQKGLPRSDYRISESKQVCTLQKRRGPVLCPQFASAGTRCEGMAMPPLSLF